MKKMKGSEVIMHFEKEHTRISNQGYIGSAFSSNEIIEILRDVRLKWQGRHVLVEKDFTRHVPKRYLRQV